MKERDPLPIRPDVTVKRAGWIRRADGGWDPDPESDKPSRPLEASEFADLDVSLDATEKRLRHACAIQSRRLELAALTPTGLHPQEIAELSSVTGVYRTLSTVAPPFDPGNLTDEQLERIVEQLSKGK